MMGPQVRDGKSSHGQGSRAGTDWWSPGL